MFRLLIASIIVTSVLAMNANVHAQERGRNTGPKEILEALKRNRERLEERRRNGNRPMSEVLDEKYTKLEQKLMHEKNWGVKFMFQNYVPVSSRLHGEKGAKASFENSKEFYLGGGRMDDVSMWSWHSLAHKEYAKNFVFKNSCSFSVNVHVREIGLSNGAVLKFAPNQHVIFVRATGKPKSSDYLLSLIHISEPTRPY